MDATKLLNKSVKIFMKDGRAFYFKVTGIGLKYITGYDDEGITRMICIEDIDFIQE